MTTALALDQFGITQQQLLRCLLRHPTGMAVEELVGALSISTNAVRQHLAALERDGFVARGEQRPTIRRPQQLYDLTDQGRELFPRHYSLLADKVISHTRTALGSAGLTRLMREMGGESGAAHRATVQQASDGQTSARLAAVMSASGYEAQSAPGAVVAHNCVFHHLAARFPEVCEYDLEFIRRATGGEVEHAECMVRGGRVCRFVLKDG